MPSDSLPQDVRDLLGTQIESYEQLVILLLVHREPTRDWSEAELTETLRIGPQLMGNAVSGLRASGLLSADCAALPPRYRYAAAGTIDAAIGRLALEYAQNPARVVKLLSANAIGRVRTSALHAFADAFVLKKKDRDRG